jgi:curved DNA-binding protein CbpA
VKDPYEILGVIRGASDEKIKSAYKLAAQSAHPDKGGSDEAMQVVNDAYESIKNDENRQEYDARLTPTETRLQFLFNSVIDGEEFEGDIIETCRAKVRKVLEDINTQRQHELSKLIMLSKLTGRVKAPGRNIYQSIILNRIAECEKAISHYDDEEELIHDVGLLLTDYEDTLPARFITAGTLTSSSTTRWHP